MSRRRRRRSSGLNLLIAIDKPFGEVTRSIDNQVGRVLRDDGVGHAGTLDPAVTGVVVLGVGQAKKLIPLLEEGKRKAYAARIDFGTQTDTDDAQGSAIREAAVPNELRDEDYARKVLASFVGKIKQRPPMYSAIKVDGVRAYDRARAGEVFELDPREVEVFEARLVSISCGECVSWHCDFVVSGGTYIRAIARDLGLVTNSAAHLGALCRTASGPVALEDCTTLSRVQELGPERISEVALDPVRLLGYPSLELSERELVLVQNGTRFTPQTGDLVEGDMVSLVYGGRLFGVWQLEDGLLRPKTNLPLGVEGVH